MENERHFYHLSSDGMSSEILFKTPEEFIAGMNRIALCLLGTAIQNSIIRSSSTKIKGNWKEIH